MLSCPHEATAVVVVGARAVADATPPCSADASSTTKQSTFLMRGAAPWSPSCTAVVAQRLICRCRHARGGKEVRSNPLHSPLIRRVCMLHGQELGGPRNTSTSTPSPGINSTFAEAAGTARRGSAGQQKVGLWGFERRDPSIIIPNHPTIHPNALLAPNVSTHSHYPCAASRSMVGVEGGGRSSSMAQGHHISSCGSAPSRGQWWRWT